MLWYIKMWLKYLNSNRVERLKRKGKKMVYFHFVWVWF